MPDMAYHPNNDAQISVRELRAAAKKAAEAKWPLGSPEGSDKRFAACYFVDLAIEQTLRNCGKAVLDSDPNGV